MQTAALYIRVSTEEQTEYSPDAQKRALLEYAKKNDLEINPDYIFVDEGISGRKAEKRPAFMKMITLSKIKPKPFDVILVHRFDRFSRSREDSIVYKSLLRKECDIRVISVTEQMEDDKFSVILEAMLEAMAEYYSLNLADEVVKGMKEKARRGGYQASPPLGYKLAHPGGIPIIVDEEAKIIQLIFEKYVYDKWSTYQIARHLNMLGLKTRYGNSFQRRSIEYILQNPMYKGYVRWNRQHKAANTIRKESEWIIEKGEHEAIISNTLFETAGTRLQKELKAGGQAIKKARPVTEYKHYLSGLLKCSNCGSTLTASRLKNCKSYFSCNGYSKGKCPVSNGISENKLLPLLNIALDTVLGKEAVYYADKRRELLSDTKLLKQLLHKLKEKEKRMKQAYLSGIDTLEEYEKNKEYLKQEEAILKEELLKIEKEQIEKEYLNKEVVSLLLKTEGKVSFSSLLAEENIDILVKNRGLKEILDRIVYNKQEECLDFYFNYS